MMIDFMVWFETLRTPFLNRFFGIITMMGDETFILAVLCVVFWCLHKKAGYLLGLSVVFNSAVNGALKDLLQVTRPYDLDDRLHPLDIETTGNTYSMPSGHAQNTTALWFSLSLSARKVFLYFSFFLLILLVVVSRVYLSVHTPLDVSVGFLLAIALTLLCHYVMTLCFSKNIYYPMLLLILPILIAMFFIRSEYFYKMAGLCFSFLIGYYIENKYIRFTVKTSLLKQIVKLAIGLSLAMLIKILVKAILPDAILFHFIRYVLLGFSVTVLSPYLFVKTHLSLKSF